jgi:hypothetical protein
VSKFYKPFILNNLSEIQEEILSVFPKDHHNGYHFFYLKNSINIFLGLPKLRKMLDDFRFTNGITKIGFAFSVMMPKNKLPVHSDSEKFRYSFNIPVNNCESSYVNFFQTSQEKKIMTTENAKHKTILSYELFDNEKCKLIESNHITSPYIMDTTVPHSVFNNSSKERIMLLIRLEPEVDNIVQQLTGLQDNPR